MGFKQRDCHQSTYGNLVNNIKQHGHLTEGNGVDILPGQNTKLMLYFHCPTKDSIQSVIF